MSPAEDLEITVSVLGKKKRKGSQGQVYSEYDSQYVFLLTSWTVSVGSKVRELFNFI